MINLKSKPPTVLPGELVVLRKYATSDADDLYEAARESVDEVFPYLPWCHPAYRKRDSVNWLKAVQKQWKSGEGYDFAILDPSDQRYLGGCGLGIDKPHTANLGYWMRTSATQKGLATEATRLLREFAFKHLGLARIEIVMAVTNLASRRVAIKAGAHFEGIIRNELHLHDEYLDAYLYSFIPSDFND